MASKLSPSAPRSKLQRGSALEAYRTSPSAKTTSSMFCDNSPKKRAPVSRGTELSQVQEELAKTKEQLALMEKSKANLLQDLARSKRQVEELTAKLLDVSEVSKKDKMRAKEMEQASFTAAEDWQVEVEVMKVQYEAATLELEANKQTMDSLNQELKLCTDAKNEAVRLAGEAMNAAEATAKRVEDLSAELLETRKAIVAGDPVLAKIDEAKSEVSRAHGDANGVAAPNGGAAPCEENAEGRAAPNGGAAPCEENAEGRAALLLASKEIELGNALQEYMSARTEIEGLKQDLVLARKAHMHPMDLNFSIENLQTELMLSKEAEMKSGQQLRSLSSELDRVTNELAKAKESERTLKSQLTEMSSAAKKVKLQLAAAKQSEEEAFEAARIARAFSDKASADIERVKESESAALSSLARVSTELEEAHEKLTSAGLEGVMLTTFLETLKAELAGNQAQLATMGMKEASARLKADTLTFELTVLREAHQNEAQLFNDKIASLNASVESLRLENDRQKLEVAGSMQRESTLNANVEALVVELKHTHDEVMELKRQEMSAFERDTALAEELENSQKEIMALKDREISLTYRVGTLLDELEAKQLVVSELSKRIATADHNSVALMVNLESSLTELARFKEKESVMNSKAAALSVALASLSEQTESRLLELKEKEKGASVKAVALHEELRRISLEFEKALTDARVAREDSNKLYESLQNANRERDQAKQQEQIAITEASQSKKDVEMVLAKADTASHELQKALEAVRAAEQKALEGALVAEVCQETSQAAQNEALIMKNETKAARESLQAALSDLQRMSKELDHEKQASQEVLTLRAELVTAKGQAMTAREETEAAMQEVRKLRNLVETAKSGEEEAEYACKAGESSLQDAFSEPEALKLGVSSMVEDEQPRSLKEAPAEVAFSQEEFTNLNLRLRDTENHLAIATTELEASSANAETLPKEVGAIKVQKECNEKAVLDMPQLLAEAEKVKLDVEAEMQRLLEKSTQWQMAKEAIDIPVHLEVNGCGLPPDCRENKPQADFPEDIMKLNTFSPSTSDKDEKDELSKCEKSVINGEVVSSNEKLACRLLKQAESPERDEGSLKDEVASQDESASLPMKKKKKNLLALQNTE